MASIETPHHQLEQVGHLGLKQVLIHRVVETEGLKKVQAVLKQTMVAVLVVIKAPKQKENRIHELYIFHDILHFPEVLLIFSFESQHELLNNHL
jgi:hypothetical protein